MENNEKELILGILKANADLHKNQYEEVKKALSPEIVSKDTNQS